MDYEEIQALWNVRNKQKPINNDDRIKLKHNGFSALENALNKLYKERDQLKSNNDNRSK